MKENDKLTYMQQIALNGEIAYAVSTAPHNAELKIRIYLILKELREDFRDYVIQAVRQITKFPEGELERVIWELTQDEVPLWMWVDKCIADIRMAVFHGELTNTPESRLSINKREAKLNLVVSAFNKFIREVSICCSPAARAVLLKIMEENDLEFLHPSCVFCLQELQGLEEIRPPKSKIPLTIFDMAFDIKNMLSFVMETEAIERANKASEKVADKAQNLMKKAKAEDKQGFMEALDEVISSVIGETIEELAGKEVEEKKEEPKKDTKGTRYIVMKRFTTSNFQVPLRDFKTRSEALVFVNELIRDFPELKKTCTFDIIRKEGK